MSNTDQNKSGESVDNSSNQGEIDVYRRVHKDLDDKFEKLKASEESSSRRYLIFTSSILGAGLSVMAIIMGINSYNQYHSIWTIADQSTKIIEVSKNNLTNLEQSTKDRIDTYIGNKNITDYEITTYDKDSKVITALLADVQRKFEDYSLYSMAILVPIKISTKGDGLGDLAGITFRLTGDLAEALAKQNEKIIPSQLRMINTLNYFGLKDVFFSKNTPVGFTFNIVGLTNNCVQFAALKRSMSQQISGRIFIKPIIKNYSGAYKEDDFEIKIDKTYIETDCEKPQK